MPSEVKRLRQLEEENGKLKRIVADLSLDKAMLQDALARVKQSRNHHHRRDTRFSSRLSRYIHRNLGRVDEHEPT